jgi:hypothetical protein
MEDIEIIHLWGENGTCYNCEAAPGSFADEDEIDGRLEVRHLCRACIARR